MKVGIITLSGSDNCGSLLQTYALQTYLEKNYNCEVEIIDYVDKFTEKTYGIFAPAIIMRPRQLFRTIQHYKRLKRQKDDYKKFRDDYLHLSKTKYRSISDLEKCKSDYDIVISGSDQVWNWPEGYVDEVYFLSWVSDEVRKIAYAPSTGGSIIENESLAKWTDYNYKDLKSIHDCLNRYDMVSVREESGQQYLSRMLGREVPLVADPTLMLDYSAWQKIVPSEHVETEYIFYYSYGYKNLQLNELVSKAATKLHLPVYVINASLWNHTSADRYGFKIYDKGGPLAYLSLMKNAKYVFAESFHGCIFAYTFKKNFWFLNNFTDGRIEARINSLLTFLELKNRIINIENFEDTDLSVEIDYSYDYPVLNELRNESAEFIEKAVKGGYSEKSDSKSVEYRIAMLSRWSDYSDEEIEKHYEKAKNILLQNQISNAEELIDRYFHVEPSVIINGSFLMFFNELKKSKWYIEQKKQKDLTNKYGYVGHLIYRVKQKYKEDGIKGVMRGIITKYKWWFRIGY